jgi:hypothetical protein
MSFVRGVLIAIAAVSAIGLVVSASNAQIVLTFEGLQNNEPIDNYYNGGLGGDGSGPGPNDGITFTPDSFALISELDGGTGNFQNNPSGITSAYFLQGAGDVMNVAGGFTTGFSFYYAAPFFSGDVQVYSGPNGTGTLLQDLPLAVTPTDTTLPTQYNTWVPIGVTFAGTAESAVFTGTANYIAFDDITLGSATPGNPSTPEPTSIVTWSLLGLCAGAYRWRSKRKTA